MDPVSLAAQAIRRCDGLLITAGAGMGVDAGLPDFRGPEGFWRAYPAAQRLGLRFEELADPRWFREDPTLAWGFYGHRLNLYRATTPHPGYATLRRWAEERESFVFTSNVDGHFLRAGFADGRVAEAHGSIHHLQPVAGGTVWSADGVAVQVDESVLRAAEPMPRAPDGGLARPNILMFGDGHWDPSRTRDQLAALDRWLARRPLGRLVVVECGAGTAIATVRRLGDTLAREGATLVRINPRDATVPRRGIGIARGAAAALAAIAAAMVDQ